MCQGLPGIASLFYCSQSQLRVPLWMQGEQRVGGRCKSLGDAAEERCWKQPPVGHGPCSSYCISECAETKIFPQRHLAQVKKMQSRFILYFFESMWLLAVNFNTPYSHNKILGDTSENKHMLDLWFIHVEMNKTSGSGVK